MTGQKMTFLGNVFHVVMTACQYKLLFYLLKHFLQAEISAERPWSMWMCHPFIVNSHFVERKVLVCSCIVVPAVMTEEVTFELER